MTLNLLYLPFLLSIRIMFGSVYKSDLNHLKLLICEHTMTLGLFLQIGLFYRAKLVS